MIRVRLRTACLLTSVLYFELLGCRPSANSSHTARNAPAITRPDSVRYQPYRLLLDQLAMADWQDRKAVFQVFRRQGFRSPAADSANRWLLRQDSLRLHTFQAAERRYGWPRTSRVGAQGVKDAYLLVQHAPAPVHASYQDTLRATYERGELSGPDYATYVDRVLLHQGQWQRYGTQSGRRVLATGQEEDYLLPVEELSALDQRRAAMQLAPLLPRLQPGTLVLKKEQK